MIEPRMLFYQRQTLVAAGILYILGVGLNQLNIL